MKKYALILIIVTVSSLQAQWSPIPQLQYTNVKCFLTVGDSTVFVAGDNGTCLRSTNNGNTWTNIINGIQADTILALGKGGGCLFAGTNGVASIYRSSDNGDSWYPANQGIPFLAQVNAFTWVDSVIYTATDRGVYSSTNNGDLWKADTIGLHLGQYYPGSYGGIAGITSVGSTVYAIKALWGGVYSTLADSIHWTPIGLDTVWGLAMASIDTNVFAGTPRGVFLYSGAGKEWGPRNSGLPHDLPFCILTAVDSLLFVYTGYWESTSLYISSDLGSTWTQINDSVFSEKTIHSLAATKTFLIAGTETGAWRLAISSLITSAPVESDRNHLSFHIDQNFPNPFNPSTTFRFDIASRSTVTLKIYDALGRETATLVNESMDPGTYHSLWNAGNFASGVYYYRLTAGSFVQTKKLLLLK